MVSEPRTEHGTGIFALHLRYGTAFLLGCAGFARNSDRVSTDHFLSELDKACYREKQVN